MYKYLKLLSLFSLAVSMTACGKEKVEEKHEIEQPQEETSFYDSLPLPDESIDRTNKIEKSNDKVEYILYINDYSYEKFYNYIMSLEKLGFNYEFVSKSVPEDVNSLVDKTETSWGANNGKTWIRVLWRDNKNTYYSGYNLQMIFDNYDYSKPISK